MCIKNIFNWFRRKPSKVDSTKEVLEDVKQQLEELHIQEQKEKDETIFRDEVFSCFRKMENLSFSELNDLRFSIDAAFGKALMYGYENRKINIMPTTNDKICFLLYDQLKGSNEISNLHTIVLNKHLLSDEFENNPTLKEWLEKYGKTKIRTVEIDKEALLKDALEKIQGIKVPDDIEYKNSEPPKAWPIKENINDN